MKSFLVVVCMTLIGNSLLAHALWIEANTNGTIGKVQEVKLFYGEYASNERDEVTKWYSDVKDCTLWLSTPGKEKIKLDKQAGSNYFAANFTPDKEGLYILTVSHEAKELAGTTKYTFSAVAVISVGKPAAIDQLTLPNTLKVAVSDAKIYKVNAPVKLKAIIDGKPWANKPVSVFTPEGWSKEFKTDEQGNIAFNPIWPGRYVLEVSNYEKTTGEKDGKAFNAAWQGATSSFEVTE